jgi:hypothetical protein
MLSLKTKIFLRKTRVDKIFWLKQKKLKEPNKNSQLRALRFS